MNITITFNSNFFNYTEYSLYIYIHFSSFPQPSTLKREFLGGRLISLEQENSVSHMKIRHS